MSDQQDFKGFYYVYIIKRIRADFFIFRIR